MNNSMDENSPLQGQFAEVFARLREQEVEQFYARYQLWSLRRRAPLLEEQISTLREHLADNQQLIQDLRPSAIALAVLARLQSNGVNDIDVLDRMLERGESWLDKMMQRLDYCEQVEDFIQGDYTQWCINSLDGAYDWMDPLLNPTTEEGAPPQSVETESGTTAEMLLQKLSREDEETTQESRQASESVLEASIQEIPLEAETPASSEEMASTIGENDGEPELQESAAEAEQMPEPALLAKPASAEEGPTPWYSVNLNESTPFDAERQNTMDDWIKVLQADVTSGIDTSETSRESEIRAEQAEASMPEAPETNLEELPVPELEDEAEKASFEGETPAETEPVEKESVTTATPTRAETELTEEATSRFTDEIAPVQEETEPVDIPQATEPEALVEEVRDAAGSSEPEEIEHPPEKDVQVEAVPANMPIESTESSPADNDAEPVGTSQTENEAEPAETILAENQAELTETPSEKDQVEPPDLVLEAGTTEDLEKIEEAAIVSLEDETHAWYEYLETDEQDNTLRQSQGEIEEQEEPKPEEIRANGDLPADSLEDSATTPGIYEYAVTDEAGNAKIVADQMPQEESGEIQHKPEEIEGWQMWDTNQDDDKTQPMVLRESQSSPEPEPIDEPTDSVDEAKETLHEAASEPMMPGSPEESTLTLAQEEHFEESPGSVESQTSLEVSEETATEAIVTQEAKESSQPLAPEEKPSKGPGFWRRLFGRLFGGI